MRRGIDSLGSTVTALLAAGQIAGFLLLGVVMHDDLAEHTAASAPDTPLDQPDPPPPADVA
ncbi:hypothetical protein ACFVY4_26780 [Streptomyces sp. NPDC058299]|uniref:hypothetical protein n=1 Tax=Streptomyces sp. NPDC058299 TaxID=3346435 RepID=UPI0036E4F6D9